MNKLKAHPYFTSLFTYEFLVLALIWISFNIPTRGTIFMKIYWVLFGMGVLVFLYHNINFYIPEFFMKRKLGPYFAFVLLEGLAVIIGLSVIEILIRGAYRDNDTVVMAVLLFYALSLPYAIVRNFIMNRYFKVVAHEAKLQAELTSLQNQINPHFYFNALNHLYGTALEEGSQRTAHVIQQFSAIMRHITEEGSKELISIEKELQFLRQYMEFQREKIAVEKQAHIKSVIEWDEQPATVLPLLVVNFIENAFKYGVSQHHDFFIHVYLYCRNGRLEMFVDNSKHTDLQKPESTSIGLENVKKRLELYYAGHYSLEVSDLPDVYKVALRIDLHKNNSEYTSTPEPISE
jgi:sensor histidine kinase YesM